jgi:hypothetical protein
VSSLRITSKEEDYRKVDEEDGNFQEQQLECKLRTYKDALSSIIELQKFSLHHNSKLFDTICRARIPIKNQASWSTTYVQKTLLNYWKQ